MAFKYGIELSTLILNIYKYIICVKKKNTLSAGFYSDYMKSQVPE